MKRAASLALCAPGSQQGISGTQKCNPLGTRDLRTPYLTRSATETYAVTKRTNRVTVWATRSVLGALVWISTAACTPGYSVNLISQTPAAVVLEYTHSVGGELQAAVQAAEARCQQYGKHARMNGQPVRLNMDRSVATFDCVP